MESPPVTLSKHNAGSSPTHAGLSVHLPSLDVGKVGKVEVIWVVRSVEVRVEVRVGVGGNSAGTDFGG